MADNKKYYYLKLKADFFDSDEMIILESMPDGHLYSNILLKLYLRSLKGDGRLMFNDCIPYSPVVLAQVLRHSVGVVEKALSILREFGLIELLENGAIYMMDIQQFIGEGSTEGDRKRIYRNRILAEKDMEASAKIGHLSGHLSATCPDIRPPEIEIEIETDKEIETVQKTTPQGDDSFTLFWAAYPKKVSKKAAEKAWVKVPAKQVPQVMEALSQFKASDEWRKDNGRFIPHPATWINGERWNDVIEIPASKEVSGRLGVRKIN